MFYNCPEIVAAVDSPLVGNRFAEEPVAGIAEAGEGCYSMLEEEEEDDILVRLVMRLINGRKNVPHIGRGRRSLLRPLRGRGSVAVAALLVVSTAWILVPGHVECL